VARRRVALLEPWLPVEPLPQIELPAKTASSALQGVLMVSRLGSQRPARGAPIWQMVKVNVARRDSKS
jgi:hypothetical protein